MEMSQYLKRVKELDVIEAFTEFTLYYDRKDKSLWIWNGDKFTGIDAEDFYKYLSK